MPPVQPPDELLRVIERAQRAAAETQAKHAPRMRGLLAKSIADLETRLARLPGDRQVAQQIRSILSRDAVPKKRLWQEKVVS